MKNIMYTNSNTYIILFFLEFSYSNKLSYDKISLNFVSICSEVIGRKFWQTKDEDYVYLGMHTYSLLSLSCKKIY